MAILEDYFGHYREGIIGIDADVPTPLGVRRIVYADWTASGRNYKPIEDRIQEEVMPLVANTHSETSTTGASMTYAYHSAKEIIKSHVNANQHDAVITAGSGMTHVVNKLQRILGLANRANQKISMRDEERPVVFITHMEHHSNHISWIETHATVELIAASADGLVDLAHLKSRLEVYKDRPLKIASVTACSNVTGIFVPYKDIATIIHEAGGYCFVDFACSAPYVDIDMHPPQPGAHLDAVFFSPHKFLGGPGSSGILVFNRELYQRRPPDQPGGGCVNWTDPRGRIIYVDEIEDREDAGTPGFLQTIKAALCIRLKEEMDTAKILDREHHLLAILWKKLSTLPGVDILASPHRDRLGIISFRIKGLHYHLATRLLNDHFGIQCRGGCSCAGTYGHHLLRIDDPLSDKIAAAIEQGDLSLKPGWVRVSLHPTMTDEEVHFIGDSIAELTVRHKSWSRQYIFDPSVNFLNTLDGPPDQLLKEKLNTNLWKRHFKPLPEPVDIGRVW